MLFHSPVFAGFLIAVLMIHWGLGRRRWAQNAILLPSSYLFYGAWDWRCLFLLFGVTVVSYASGLLLDRGRGAVPGEGGSRDGEFAQSGRPGRRMILVVGVLIQLGVLWFFKYHDFFASSLGELLDWLSIPDRPRVLHLVLPVGISFFTFQAIGYLVDVYRGDLRASRRFVDFALFLAFFPQLVAGPIVRAGDLLPQLDRRRRFDRDRFFDGVYLAFWGLFKKAVLADNLSPLVDTVFGATGPARGADGNSVTGSAVIVAVYAFALQIYCDFSGYTDIARGCGKMFGIELCQNFRWPYLSATPSDFWRRWHISLSTWLRDYLYVPLGGNRGRVRRVCLSLMVTMILGGLWHGAAWTFLVWGFYHGLLLCAYRVATPAARTWIERRSTAGRSLIRVIGVVVFFHFTCLGWLIFRAESLGQVVAFLGLVVRAVPEWMELGLGAFRGCGGVRVLILFLPLAMVQILQWWRNDVDAVRLLPVPARAVLYAGLGYGLILFGGGPTHPFIYFQF